MVFNENTQFLLVLDATEGGVNYSQDLEYLIDLGQRSGGGAKKDYIQLTSGSGNSENAVNSGIAGGKKRNPEIGFLAYYGKEEKSNDSLQNAINNGDFVASSFDPRFNVPAIESVDTVNDSVTVSGDLTERAKSGNTIVIDGSTGNDGLYNIDSLSYDSGADETTITVVGDITDATADGVVSDGVKTVVEQKTWLEEYVFDGRIGEEYTLRGQEYEDSVGGGRRIVLNQAEIVRDVQQLGPFMGQGQIQTNEGFNVG